jgi:hypothetical protein
MSVLEFNLYRAKFVKGKQLPLNFQELSPSEIFKKVIMERPSIEFREGYQWHIGNIEEINESTGYFAVGRTTTSIMEKYDLATKNFIEELYDASPYTHVLYDLNIGIIAIARKSKLAPTTMGISSKIERMFSITDTIISSGIDVDIDIIRDPRDFLDKIRRSYAIKKFTASFGGPNPFDADDYFQKPMSIYLRESNGKYGKTIIEGDDLDHGVVEKVTVAIAATGNDASARIQEDHDRKVETIYLGESTVKVNVPEEDFTKEGAMEAIVSAYQGIREL